MRTRHLRGAKPSVHLVHEDRTTANNAVIMGDSRCVNSRVNPTVFELQYKKPRLDRGFSFLTLCLSYLNVVTRQLKMVHLRRSRQLKLGQLMAQFVHIT